ncbi:hypothetical protein BCR32DRAFT_284189 [Anaeromyces robustus]|uniref:Uncharacterized protein n=1 Tax=Anaeromyces robustus TaxID=1754192 RepID=A0A1Y1WSJ6_9FUNG|nr:hypothetical protein BCR32DRAFT_284189 [Anaeromyces robustus]|eukprot:ORX76422.1 hypothetical protein BCR32DRAFT_284189 [Anaeromyces robustus]
MKKELKDIEPLSKENLDIKTWASNIQLWINLQQVDNPRKIFTACVLTTKGEPRKIIQELENDTSDEGCRRIRKQNEKSQHQSLLLLFYLITQTKVQLEFPSYTFDSDPIVCTNKRKVDKVQESIESIHNKKVNRSLKDNPRPIITPALRKRKEKKLEFLLRKKLKKNYGTKKEGSPILNE